MAKTMDWFPADTVQALLADGKGILAADETPNTLTGRFQPLGIASTEESRRDFRELLFRTNGISQYISGVILNHETICQHASDGTPMVKLLLDQGIVPGVKVDKGTQPLAGAPGERIAEGLDGLRTYLQEYRTMGIRFTKWRAVIKIGPGIPSRYCIEANAHALARYAALSQEVGLIPLIEPEVLLDGDHSIDECFAVTEATLREVFYQMGLHRTELETMLLKPSMVLSGKDAPDRAGPDEVAERTIACFKRTVPAAIPGILFLSGGQSDDEASTNLNAICAHAARLGAPWQISFSFARALEGAPMQAWAGKPENREAAQQAFRHRAAVVSAARRGAYEIGMKPERMTI